jgi:hypothetical protein
MLQLWVHFTFGAVYQRIAFGEAASRSGWSHPAERACS